MKKTRHVFATTSENQGQVKLFVSHAHCDRELAHLLVDAINDAMDVPVGAIRCTSVPGYQLDLGTMAADTIRRELASARCMIALLTPNSLASEWCQFELGAAWALAKETLPLLAGGLRDSQIPAPFRGAAGGQAKDPVVLVRLLNQVRDRLGYPQKNQQAAIARVTELAHTVATTVLVDEVDREWAAGLSAKYTEIGPTQAKILDYITRQRGTRAQIPQAEIYQQFKDVETHLFYRLEQLRLMGFLNRKKSGTKGGQPDFDWSLSRKYQEEIG